mmetsp:Transcript_20002/g.76697  ORF Transcript_20002/g.76697 Transcript_20002/m.76697 type:complete len:255 (-) Transcript_20002:43-807(-)
MARGGPGRRHRHQRLGHAGSDGPRRAGGAAPRHAHFAVGPAHPGGGQSVRGGEVHSRAQSVDAACRATRRARWRRRGQRGGGPARVAAAPRQNHGGSGAPWIAARRSPGVVACGQAARQRGSDGRRASRGGGRGGGRGSGPGLGARPRCGRAERSGRHDRRRLCSQQAREGQLEAQQRPRPRPAAPAQSPVPGVTGGSGHRGAAAAGAGSLEQEAVGRRARDERGWLGVCVRAHGRRHRLMTTWVCRREECVRL